jgi:3-oxoacyl-[acyl-carrier protein] reductase
MSIALSLKGKVALITGGSRGIGASAVRMFADAGARVVFNYRKEQKKAEELVDEVGRTNCVAFGSDLSTPESAQKLVASTVNHFGRIDILVANHGVWPPQDVAIDQMPDSQWRNTIDVNLSSVYGLIKHSVAHMKRQKTVDSTAGHIVLVSSTSGQRGEAFHCDYAATKGALISMVKGLSTELARDRIYVNSVAPGWVQTDMSEPALNDPRTRDAILATIPMKRVATPEEIAAPILFLCTQHAGFITGEVFNVNGGAVLAG